MTAPLARFHKFFRISTLLFFLVGTFFIVSYSIADYNRSVNAAGHLEVYGYIYTRLSFAVNYLFLTVVLFRLPFEIDKRQTLTTAGIMLANIPVVALYLVIYGKGIQALTFLPRLANPFSTF